MVAELHPAGGAPHPLETAAERTGGTIKTIESDLGAKHSDKFSPRVHQEILGALHTLGGSDTHFKADLATITKQLHQDGYLPGVSLIDIGNDQAGLWKSNPKAEASGGHKHAPNEALAQQDTAALQTAMAAPGNSGTAPGSDTGGTAATGADTTTSPAGVSISGGEVATANQIIQMLMAPPYNLSKAGAAGVVGNMMQENSLHTDFNSGGAGLCQWIGSRQTDLVNFAKQNGESPTSVKAQVGFMMHELSTSAGYSGLLNELKTTNNAASAATDFEATYERAGIPENAKRAGYAVSAFNSATGTKA